MINMTYNAKEHSLKIEGHAEFGEPGKDPVCAGVSALFYTLCQALTDLEDTALEGSVNVDMGKGYGLVKCVPMEKRTIEVELVFWTVLEGLQMMAESYPDNLKMEIL